MIDLIFVKKKMVKIVISNLFVPQVSEERSETAPLRNAHSFIDHICTIYEYAYNNAYLHTNIIHRRVHTCDTYNMCTLYID